MRWNSESRIQYCYPASMGKAVWGAEPEFFGPRHAYRESRISRRLLEVAPESGLHLECAAGVGSLSLTLARQGRNVVAADLSLRSLAVLAERSRQARLEVSIRGVVADITQLPFRAETFDSATTAETLEHIPDHEGAVIELARVLAEDAWVVGTVPAGPTQWSDWDDWAGHLRRYSKSEFRKILDAAGLEPHVTVWGWPTLRIYDDLFLKRINRRRLVAEGSVDADPTLRRVSGLGRNRWLVNLVRAVFSCDRLFDGAPWGVGLLFAARKPRQTDAAGRAVVDRGGTSVLREK